MVVAAVGEEPVSIAAALKVGAGIPRVLHHHRPRVGRHGGRGKVPPDGVRLNGTLRPDRKVTTTIASIPDDASTRSSTDDAVYDKRTRTWVSLAGRRGRRRRRDWRSGKSTMGSGGS